MRGDATPPAGTPGAASGGLVVCARSEREYTPAPSAAPTHSPGEAALAAEIASLDDAELVEQVLVLATAPSPLLSLIAARLRLAAAELAQRWRSRLEGRAA